MDDTNQLKTIYEQLRKGHMSKEDAAKQFGSIAASQNSSASDCLSISPDIVGNKAAEFLLQAASKVLKVSPHEIDMDIELIEYGFNAFKLTELLNELNQEYDLVLKQCDWLEYSTLRSIGERLNSEYPEKLGQHSISISPNFIVEQSKLDEEALQFIMKLISSVLKLSVDRLEPDAPMEIYGIDSMMVLKLTKELEITFGSLSKTLFFEYQTIRELTGYFLEDYRDIFIRIFHKQEKPLSEAKVEGAAIMVSGNYNITEQADIPRSSFHDLIDSAQHDIGNETDIAIIGVSGRYPGAENLREFWDNLQAGKDCVTEIPEERWDHSLYFNEDKDHLGTTYSKWGGFIKHVDCFDPLFFNISPREAEIMDPQERLFLECTYEAMEDAGYTRQTLGSRTNNTHGGNVGVFVGVMYEEYQLYGAQEQAVGNMIALSGNPSSIANRVSYFCDFHGPSMAVDTMCSSSLTAIHLACLSLQRGECQAALAGGVNISIHPNKYLMLAQGKFASSKGRCESFGQGGDGYVPGEGVGAVLLKPLSKAIADGDQIYGIIKATSINHGGKTNGYSVPNPNVQAEVIGKTLEQAGINPRAISYIEAHGTGTTLGDPIEISGLCKAFESYTKDTQFCAIGSAKSNIGHCEGAAGIAGVTKVLLQLKYKKLVPSLHSKELNPHIDFSGTPFTVQQELAEWRRPMLQLDGKMLEYPRIAGVSSFGAGGSNAHILIEEYIPEEQEQRMMGFPSSSLTIIVLSAKNNDRLRELAQKWLHALRNRHFQGIHLADAAYTLQVGREDMEERLAIIVESFEELEIKLKDFIEGRDAIQGLSSGRARQNKDTLSLFAEDEMTEAIDRWIQQNKLEKLADIWVKGFKLDWTKLYGVGKPRRISLITYPFARGRYWIPESGTKSNKEITQLPATSITAIHPLLHVNTSSLLEQRFSTTFTGMEFYLSDHKVQGERVLPGVAYLEMARAAVFHAAELEGENETAVWLKNMVWSRPLVVGEQPRQVHIALMPEDNGEISYEIYSDAEAEETEPVALGQGSAVLLVAGPAPFLELSKIREECSLRQLGSPELYEAFRTMGIVYGPGQQGVESLDVGKGQVLAKLVLPAVVKETKAQYVLHPSLMDGALQAVLGLMTDTASSNPGLPFALQELEIYKSCTSSMWAFIRYSEGSGAGDKVQKVDIDLCEEDGTVCIRMRGFSSRVLEGGLHRNTTGPASPAGLLPLTPVWDPVSTANWVRVADQGEHIVVAGGTKEEQSKLRSVYPHIRVLDIGVEEEIAAIAAKLEAWGTIRHLVWIAPQREVAVYADEALIEGQEQGVLQVFRWIKALLQVGYGVRELEWSVITAGAQALHARDTTNPVDASIHGLIGSMAKEYPDWRIGLLDVEPGKAWPVVDILALPPSSQGRLVVYRGGEWYEQKLVPLQAKGAGRTSSSAPNSYRTGGVYVVIGGAGGIGEAWSEHMIRTYQAQIVWIGRRGKNEEIQEKLNRLAALGPAPRYIRADATNRAALQAAYQEIKEEYGQIHGVIHAAIVLLDQSLAKMDEERFRASLSAKVDVSVRIAQVFGKESLDWVLFFSSMNAFSKAAGQSNYAAGCTFKDAFARCLARQWPCAVKVMNWGYWGSIGIVASEAYQQRMAQAGVGSIEPPEAMEAIERLLEGRLDQVALMKTTKPLKMEGVEIGEWVAAYPKQRSFEMESLPKQPRERSEQILAVKSKGSARMEEIDELLRELLRGQLQSLGLLQEKTAPEAGEIPGVQGRWLEESLALLQRHTPLRSESGEDVETLWAEWDEKKTAWLADPNLKAQIILVEATMQALPAILTGKVPATEILFPRSSMERVEGVYKHNLVADYFNEALGDTLLAYIEGRLKEEPSAQIRILEIGAGTGGTSAGLFPRLRPYKKNIQEYGYTDLSKAFLLHAEREYGAENEFLSYQLFNVEKSPTEQGMDAGSYDLVIATNVLHATKNIRQTLRNTKALLKNNGLLLLNEISSNTLFTHLTFGLLEGWWLYEDPAVRIPGCPGLYPEIWQKILEDEGFRDVAFPAEEAHELGQQLVIAQSDGIVRQNLLVIPNLVPVQNREALETPSSRPPVNTSSAREESDHPAAVRERGRNSLKRVISETIKIPVDKINSAEPLETYGIDSILVVQLTNALSKELSDVTSTLFFEYQTIDALLDYFLKTQKDSFCTWIGMDQEEVANTGSSNKPPELLVQSGKLDAGFMDSRLNRFDRYRTQRKIELSPLPAREGLVQDIAIIGLSGRYAGSSNVKEFWDNLKDGKNCISEIPEERWNWKDYYNEERGKKGSIYTRWGGFIEDIDKFDPLFFQISPREAEQMDPQERLFLQIAYSSIEDAGYTPSTLAESRRIGVFVGVMNGNYSSGSTYWSIANRISYLLNFQGPSMAIDTACSSSLTAVHLALESLYSGGSECAIAGGVNLILDPVHYMKLSAMNMLSSSNQCNAFGDQADGFVDGEGVGAIVLKPLSKAIADGDHIYGVIKGSMVNAGGKTNGYTVPNPNAQFQLVVDTLKKTGIHSRAVSYVEAHGTGTSLGDPIEISGLTRAFELNTKDKQFCAIGSVKSNIGHCESAAGIAGITKILMQLKHGKLVPSLHAVNPNPSIPFSQTPFVVQQKLTDWQRPTFALNGIAREYPRIAGISSFGAGGANAHILIEEFVPVNQERSNTIITSRNPALILLSAKTEERLMEQAKQLRSALQEQSDICLADWAYTLQVGREAMEERLAILAGSVQELEGKLTRFIDGSDDVEALYRGQAKRNKDTMSLFLADEDMQEVIASWIGKRKYAKLLDLWVKGLQLDWNNLYEGDKPHRVSLPTYPFAKERYWISAIKPQSVDVLPRREDSNTGLHPLLQKNTSDLSEQRYTSTFSGAEFFLADHKINGVRMLPGVAYLEMARAAVSAALGKEAEEALIKGQVGIQLRNIVWTRSVIVDEEPVQVNIRVFPETDKELSYEIYSELAGSADDFILHNQGRAVLRSLAEVPALRLNELKEQCNRNKLTADECYEAFAAAGIHYGPSFRGIQEIYIGLDKALAKLVLPSPLTASVDQFVLHPSLLDSALQSTMALLIDSGKQQTALPFAIQEVEILRACTMQMWAVVRFSEDRTSEEKVRKFDLDLCDEEGNRCVIIKGFSTRVVEHTEMQNEFPYETLLLEPSWMEQELTGIDTKAIYNKHMLVICELDELTAAHLSRKMEGVICLSLNDKNGSIEERFTSYSIQLMDKLQSLLQNSREPLLVQLVICPNQGHRLLSGLSGMLKTAHLEYPHMIGQVIELESEESPQDIIEKVLANSQEQLVPQVRYQRGKRFVADYKELNVVEERVSIPWKDGGVYLITGGLGGLGSIFAKEIAEQTKNVTLIIAGRSTLSEEKQLQCKALSSLGAQVVYKQADLTEQADVLNLFWSIKEDFGNLHGILHSAGVVRDNFLLKKDGKELQDVLSPKVKGLVSLDQASKEMQLDFFVLFSSIAGELGNAGQADYSAANAFMDKYAEYRNQLVARNERYGQTLSINWPLWKEGGMQVGAVTEKLLLQTMGMIAMEKRSGINAFYQGLASGRSQVMVMEGNPAMMRRKLLALTSPAAPKRTNTAQTAAAVNSTQHLLETLHTVLIQNVSELLKVKKEDIDLEADLNEYGFDSITFTEFSNKLNQEYGLDSNPTLFFEHSTLNSLASFLVQEYQSVFEQHYTAPPEEEEYGSGEESYADNDAAAVAFSSKRNRFRFADMKAAPVLSRSPDSEPIAIIGMSGIFPMARDLDEFWKNLLEGKDCISEIPEDRWDWKEYYGDPDRETNKTNIKWGGFIDGIAEFDPLFFGISPREAEQMDPQQRLLMIYAWKAIEDAGYSSASLSRSNTGIFVGTMVSGYSMLTHRSNIAIDGSSSTGMAPSVGPNRMSYFLNIHGPSEPIETACSSSLVAIHRAISAMREGSCEMALVGGVNTIITPELHISFDKAGMLSKDGRCKTFSSQANGYVRGEGAGMIFLKKLAAAERDGDHIYGVIRSVSENHGGRSSSLTAPNPKAQADLLKNVYTKAGIDPRSVGYIEAHGTGTELGDPIEINGLNAAFKELYKATGNSKVESVHCGLGSVKTNIGHLELAAGIAGVIKVLLQLKHKTLVRSLHSETINPYIQLQDSPFYIVQETKEWETIKDSNGNDLPRRAGVSSFGFGGVNAHVIIEEYIPQQRSGPLDRVTPENPAIIVLSAKNQDRLKAQAEQLLSFILLQPEENFSLAEMGYTLQLGRDEMEGRLGIITSSKRDLENKLQHFLAEDMNIEGLYVGQVVKSDKAAMSLFTGNDELQEAVDKWIQRKKYGKLLEFWVKGLSFDWNILYKSRPMRRMSLPTYPFSRDRYWIPVQEKISFIPENDDEHRITPVELQGGDETKVSASNIIAVISNITGYKTEQLTLEKRFSELSFDSILMIKVAKEVINYHNFLDSPEESERVLQLLTAKETTLQNLIDYIEQERSEVQDEDREGVAVENLDKLNRKRKKDVNNLTCSNITGNLSNTPYIISGRLIVDESHPFFFDHSIDHVSGIQLIEAMSEIARVGWLSSRRVAPESFVFIAEAEVSFNTVCKKELESRVSCVLEHGSVKENSMTFRTEVMQDDKTVAKGNYRIVSYPLDEEESHLNPIEIINRKEQCNQRIVNKDNLSNVLLSDVIRGNGPEDIGFYLSLQPDNPFFNDYPGNFVDTVVLMEACRQSSRAFGYFIEGPDKAQHDFNGIIPVLKSIKISLQRPIKKTEVVFLKKETFHIAKVSNNGIMEIKSEISINGIKIGKCMLETMMLSEDFISQLKLT